MCEHPKVHLAVVNHHAGTDWKPSQLFLLIQYGVFYESHDGSGRRVNVCNECMKAWFADDLIVACHFTDTDPGDENDHFMRRWTEAVKRIWFSDAS